MFTNEQLNEFRRRFSEEELREVLTYEYSWAITNQSFKKYSNELNKLVSKEPSLVSIIRNVLRQRILKCVYPHCLLKMFENYNVKYRLPSDVHYQAIFSNNPEKVSRLITRESDIYPVISNSIKSTSMTLFKWCLQKNEFKDYFKRTHVGNILGELIGSSDYEMFTYYLKTLDGNDTLKNHKELIRNSLNHCHSQDIIRTISETLGNDFMKSCKYKSPENLWEVYMKNDFKRLFEYDVVKYDLRETYKYLSLNLNIPIKNSHIFGGLIDVKHALIRNSSFRISELYQEFAKKYCLIIAIRIGHKELLDYALERFDGMVATNNIGRDSCWIYATNCACGEIQMDKSYKNILIHAIQNNNEYAVRKIIEKYPSMLLMTDSYGSNVLLNSVFLDDNINQNLFKLLSEEITKRLGEKCFNVMIMKYNKTNFSALSLMDFTNQWS